MKKLMQLPSAIAPTTIQARSHEFQRSLLHAVVEISPDGILVVDENDKVVCITEQFVRAFGISVDDICSGQVSALIGTSDEPILSMVVERVKNPEAFLARVKELYSNPDLKDHCEIELKDGRTLERHSTALSDSNGKYLGRVWFFRDITGRKQVEAELRDLARHDPLTGFPNRRYFFERGNEEFARARRHKHNLSVLVIDLDDFKQVNDRYGHMAGDQVLRSLCECSTTVTRKSEVFARIGGEEFCALLLYADLPGATVVAERLRQTVMGQKVIVGNHEISYRFSGGIATMNSSDRTIEDVLRRADLALYNAKKNGKDRIEIAAE
jgi:diguanylate cyclase (GGDEF)-like protein/PAS domain S-box-containing protein